MSKNKNRITVETAINATLNTVWEKWSSPSDIEKWYFATKDWHTPRAKNDLVIGGKFNFRMEAKDGSTGFDFEGVYNNVIPYQLIEYTIFDGRKVKITFAELKGKILVTETFEAEDTHPHEIQKAGWQAILDNFKEYVEMI